MSGSRSSAVSGRASRDVLVAAACHCRTVNLPTLVIEPVDSVPVPAIGLVTNTLRSKCPDRSNSWMVAQPEVIPIIEKSKLTKCLRNGNCGNLPTPNITWGEFTDKRPFGHYTQVPPNTG